MKFSNPHKVVCNSLINNISNLKKHFTFEEKINQ